jgi:hypothetical protein
MSARFGLSYALTIDMRRLVLGVPLPVPGMARIFGSQQVTIFSFATSERTLNLSFRNRCLKINSLECVCEEIYAFGR